jgi:homogentisate phytyltransferase/homogentisate geranylgeranyltransferase
MCVCAQIGFWAHMQATVLGHQGAWHLPGNVLYLSGLMTWFSIVIALFKDLPDVLGDERANIQTATVVHGVKPVFWTCIALLQAAYASAIWYSVLHCTGWVRALVIGGQAAFALILSRKAQATDLSQHSQIVDAYMFIWKLFYAQYLLVPFM